MAQYSTIEAYHTEKARRTAGAALWTYAFENLDSKMKKSIRSVNKGEACKARSIRSGSLNPAVGIVMRSGKKKRRDQ